MRYAAVLLVALIGACNFSPFGGDYAKLTDVKVSPTALRAGDQFVASANVVFQGSCAAATTTVTYEPIGSAVSTGTAVSQTFTAALNGTLVRFAAYCTSPSRQNFLGGPDDLQDIRIQVLPAP